MWWNSHWGYILLGNVLRYECSWGVMYFSFDGLWMCMGACGLSRICWFATFFGATGWYAYAPILWLMFQWLMLSWINHTTKRLCHCHTYNAIMICCITLQEWARLPWTWQKKTGFILVRFGYHYFIPVVSENYIPNNNVNPSSPKGVATTPQKSFRPGAQNRTAKG